MTRPKLSNDVRFRLFQSNDDQTLFDLFNFALLCLTILDVVRLCLTFFGFVHFTSH